MRRWTYWLAGSLLAFAGAAQADERDYNYIPRIPTESRMIVGPKCLSMQDLVGFAQCDPTSHQDFMYSMRHWRMERKIYVGYDGARYDAPGQRWTQSRFVQPTMMVEDRFFFDLATGKYTVDRYLDDLEKRYGGIDNVVVWPSYPNLGIDNRNQLDMILAMPGGVAGVREMVADFHRRGVRVYFPINMWDEGTRDPGRPWPDEVADLMKQLNADGVFGDTQDGVPLAFPQAAEKNSHALAFQTELWPSDEDVAWNLSSWWQEAPSVYQQFAPPIDRYKWIEPRHIPVVATRWSRDKTDAFQVAYFNGIGIESWENIFGFWNGLTARDGEALRRVASLERGIAPFLVSQDWEPFYPMRNFGVFSSRWPLSDQTVWTVVNRNEYPIEGRQMNVKFKAGERYFDLYRGEEHQAGARRRQCGSLIPGRRPWLWRGSCHLQRAGCGDDRADGENENALRQATLANLASLGRRCRSIRPRSRRPNPRKPRPKIWWRYRAAVSISASRASKWKAAIRTAWTSPIPGRIRPGVSIATTWPSILSLSTATMSPMRSSNPSWTRRIISPKTRRTSSRIGGTAAIPMAGRTSR